MFKKSLAVVLVIIFYNLATVVPTLDDQPLPPPFSVNVSLEMSIFRRSSVREFSKEPISEEELSTILWAAYGLRDDGKRTVSGIEGTHAVAIYVLKEDAVYKYDATNHSLVFYKEGDFRDIVGWQYKAPIQLCLVWDKDKNSDENLAGAEIGMVGQNIALMANALELGTVPTVEMPSPIEKIGLPSNEVGRIVMPLGHPRHPYDFVYKPMWVSLLPMIKESDLTLSTALLKRNESTVFTGELTREEQSHIVWSAYGYSYLLDNRESTINVIKRHRTVPSAHGYYPLDIYVVTESGIYRYIPGIHRFDKWGLPILTFLMKVIDGDKRQEIALASKPFLATAPFIVISVLNIRCTIRWDDLSAEKYRWIWYYEAGASAHNLLLEATAWNLSANIVVPTDAAAIRSILRLNQNFIPLLIVPVGK
jgi:nitroreductase